MKLISAHIENFGKISNFDHDFSSGKNIIHEDNGWGKSTFASFIRVMFYGFLGDGKKDIIENERKRFKPWQPGVYGGSIVFEAGGKRYRMEKSFGDKKSGSDSFSLFDASTNLMSSDFTEKVGEELFGIDADSFMRTVFIAQQDCQTTATVGIRAKIGDVSDETADMGDYDKVKANIEKYLNANTPDRATGKLNKLASSIAALREKIRGRDEIAGRIAELSRSIRALKEKCASGEEKYAEVQKKAEILSAQKDRQLEAQKYEGLVKAEEIARKKYEEEMSAFPGRVPQISEIDEAIQNLEGAQRRKDALPANKAAARALGTVIESKEQKNASTKKGKLIGIIMGVLLIASAAAVWFVLSNMTVAIALGAAGLITLIISLIVGSRKPASYDDDAYEYDEMMRAIEEDEEYIARAEESCDEFFDNYGMDRPRAPLQALGRLRDSVRETEKLKKELDDAVSRKEDYERDHDVSKLNGADFGDALSLEALNSEAKQIKEEIENNRRALKQQESDYNTAIEKQGIMDDDAEELQRQEEEQAALKHKYDIALKAAGFLERAKESFSSKYMDEIKESFDKYHDLITDSPDKYELDANLNILLREAGATHDIRALSEGYQDLVGLCRRMAMIDAMYDMEKPFLIFDDPFVNLDEKRLEGAMGFLEKISHDYQIIYFSCHESRCG